jgi:membrane protease YdiL (CAAX protease family)
VTTGPRTLHPGWRLALFLLFLTLLAAVAGGLFFLVHFPPQRSHGVLQPLPLLGTGVAAVAVVVGATLACLRVLERRTLATVGLAGGRARSTSIGTGLLLGAIVPLVVAGVLLLSGHATVERPHLSGADLVWATLPMALATVLLSSWEEIAFRGYPLQMVSGIGGPWLATAVTGVLFGVAHSGNPGANLLGFANTALNGVLLGWIVVRSGSLWLTCGYHAGWNLAASVLLGMRDSGTISPGSPFSTTLTGPAWLSGGTYGFEASVLTGVIETILLLAVLANVSRLPSVTEARPYFLGVAGA